MLYRNIRICISLWSWMATMSMAGEVSYTSFLPGNAIIIGGILETDDGEYLSMSGASTSASWHGINKNVLVDNFIHLKYTHAANVHYTADWSIEVACNVERWNEHGVLQPLETCTLKIDYKIAAGTKYTDISTYRNLSPGGHKVRVTVTNITFTGLTAMPADVLLENFIRVERRMVMNPSAFITINHQGGGVLGCASSTDNVEIFWNYLFGAEEYDLEWLFRSEYDVLSPIDFTKASRITTTNQYYTLSATFDNGMLMYRVRGISKDFATGTQRLEGQWSQATTVIPVCNIEKRNWTYNAVYAEEGKRKEVMTYFDGRGLTRQSVTLSNTENVELVAESMYDYEGRPSIQTLPAPSKSFRGNLKFYQSFSLNAAGTPYSKKDFDTDAVSPCVAIALTPGMNSSATSDGASLYYSENNPLVNPGTPLVIPDNGFNVLIPDADDYPFTQTVYSNDGSVKLQSGVGPTHAIKSGHETQYFNVTASQSKLDRLFGNEVGFSKHYNEKVVVDPNGQISVSYENLSGQVIATCMRGFAPQNLMELGPAVTEEKYMAPEQIMEQFTNQYNPASESYVSSTNFMVSDISTPYDFSYSITPQTFSTICNKEYKCKYLLKITIRDDCGNVISEKSGGSSISTPLLLPVLDKVHKIDAANFASGPFTASFSVNFPHLGVYRIEKSLSLDPDGLRDAKVDFEAALRNGCIKTLDQYIAEYQAGVDMTECLTCEEVCDHEANSIDWSQYNASTPYIWDANHSFASAADYIAFCKGQCRPEIPKKDCNGLLAALKADMSPSGQYFESMFSSFMGSTFSPSEPYFYVLSSTQFSTLPSSSTFYLLWQAYSSSHGCSSVPPPTANWKANLAAIWDPCWEDYLVLYHPEYCRWERCKLLATSYDFDADLLRTDYQESTTTQPSTGNPYLNLTTSPIGKSILDLDPFFAGRPIEKGVMLNLELIYCQSCIAQFPICATCPIQVGPPSNSMWDWATVAPNKITAPPFTNAYNEAQWRNFTKLYIGIKAMRFVKGVPCPALPDITYPPDNLSDNLTYLGSLASGGLQTILLNGMTINDPEALINFQTAINNSANPANPNSPNAPYNTVPKFCTYSSSKATISIHPQKTNTDPVIPLNASCLTGSSWQCTPYPVAFPSINTTYVFYVNINQIPQNYPINNTAVNWSNSSCYIRISNPVILPPITDASSIADIINYLNLIKQAINNYQSSPYDFSCIIHPPASLGASYSYEIIAPSSLGPLGNAANLEWSIEMTSSDQKTVEHCTFRYAPMDFSNAVMNCDTTPVYAPHCLCIQLAQGMEYYNSKTPKGDYKVDHKQYPTVEDYLAANLSDATLTVSPAQVLFWMQNCLKNGNTSPLMLDANGNEVNSRTMPIMNNNHLPRKFNCRDTCQQQGMEEAGYYANEAFEHSIYQAMQNFIIEYKKACLNEYKLLEDFRVKYYEKEYHYTLYYYDQADNLVRTVPPNAVKRISSAVLYVGGLNQVHEARLDENLQLIFPGHSRVGHSSPGNANLMVTNYKYNTLNQLVEQETPDGGLTKFWYNKIGQLRFSQNAKQKQIITPNINGLYSYTIYDGQGRIIEVGENSRDFTTGSGAFTLDAPFYSGVNNVLFPAGNGKQVTKTHYDKPLPGLPFTQNFLRKRVATVTYEDLEDNSDLTFNTATHYSYDVHGNVNVLTQDYPELAIIHNRYKKIEYKFDLISGNVNEVRYQPGEFDQYYHRYEYNANNQITNAYTSNDKIHWQLDARYFYFLHGPLARTEIGEEKVQGLDYAYNLQGWIKGVNSNTLSAGFDPGKDGYSGDYFVGQTDIHKNTARDVFGYSLEYYGGDYKSIASNPLTNNNWGRDITGSVSVASGGTPFSVTPDLFNGNIKAMATAMYQPGVNPGALPTEINTIAKFFMYDQLNRIKEAQSYLFAPVTTALNGVAPYTVTTKKSSEYYESFNYDPNGNILKAFRNGPSGTGMDDMTYKYYNLTRSNRLAMVNDAVSSTNFSEDIDDQSTSPNYKYDEIGNLISDHAEKITKIDWSVYGKIQKIYKSGSQPNIEFKYDASGNRIQKILKSKTGSTEKTQEHWITTYYVRDAQGTVMTVYERKINLKANLVQDQLLLKETHIYGRSRLGIEEQADRLLITPTWNYASSGYNSNGTISGVGLGTATTIKPQPLSDHLMGNKRYELSNHLGNVNVAISDRKLSIPTTGASTHDYYLADAISNSDYFSFGAEMVGRTNSGDYRYGFNGKENDDEVKGVIGSQQDYGRRIYDPRLAKFLSPDPLTKDYPWYSPFQFAGNKPINSVDLDGLEEQLQITYFYDVDGKLYNTIRQLVTGKDVKEGIQVIELRHTYSPESNSAMIKLDITEINAPFRPFVEHYEYKHNVIVRGLHRLEKGLFNFGKFMRSTFGKEDRSWESADGMLKAADGLDKYANAIGKLGPEAKLFAKGIEGMAEFIRIMHDLNESNKEKGAAKAGTRMLDYYLSNTLDEIIDNYFNQYEDIPEVVKDQIKKEINKVKEAGKDEMIKIIDKK